MLGIRHEKNKKFGKKEKNKKRPLMEANPGNKKWAWVAVPMPSVGLCSRLWRSPLQLPASQLDRNP